MAKRDKRRAASASDLPTYREAVARAITAKGKIPIEEARDLVQMLTASVEVLYNYAEHPARAAQICAWTAAQLYRPTMKALAGAADALEVLLAKATAATPEQVRELTALRQTAKVARTYAGGNPALPPGDAMREQQRLEAIEKLKQIDPNGVWSDEDNDAAGYDRLTWFQAREKVRELELRDFEAPPTPGRERLKANAPVPDDENWKPLLKVVGEANAEAFMFMGTANGPRTPAGADVTVYKYKHGGTRHYLNVGDDGRLYAYLGEGPDSYEAIDRDTALLAAMPAAFAPLPEPSKEGGAGGQ